MSFIKLSGIDDVKELPVAAEARYDLCIISAKPHEKDGVLGSIQCIIEIEGDVKYQNIFHYVGLPKGEDASKDQMSLLMARRFFEQFSIPYDNGVEIEQIVGSRANCAVKQDEYQGQKKNVLQLDRLAEAA